MTYLVRPATEAEREAAIGPWTTLLAPSRPRGEDGKRTRDPDAGAALTRLGRVSVARGWLVEAMRAAVEDALFGDHPCGLLVADHPDAPGLAVGWLAWRAYLREPLTLLAIVVAPEARGAWVGRTLLRHALEEHGPEARCSVMTDAGRRLLGHVRTSMRGEAAA